VRRAALAAACVALAVALLPPAGGGAATPCVAWKKHHKRVVKYVNRGGERKRIVRVVRWRTCARRAVASPVVPAPPVAPEPPAPALEDPAIPRLGVKAVEWSYTLSRPEVPAGELVIELNNMGEDPHNLNLQLEDGSGLEGKITTVGPSAQGKAKFTLPAGTYRLWCDLDGHDEQGMNATLVVTP
jgi:plastocyanin